MDELLTVYDLVKLLKIKTATVYAWTRQGRIPHIRIANKVRYPLSEINAWLVRQTRLETEVKKGVR